MSVIATVKVYDGIVLGAESMTQLVGLATTPGQYPPVIKSYENAQKLFQVLARPVGILTYGLGNIGRRSVESFVHEFSRTESSVVGAVNVEQTARRFYDFIRAAHTQSFGNLPTDQQPAMGFVVAGYSAGDHLASQWEFMLPQSPEPVSIGPHDSVGASWRGVGNPFTRLMYGLDPTIEQRLRQSGASESEIQRLNAVVRQLATQVAFDGMPLGDAIGYCKFIIQTTIGWCTYATGAAACGGPIKLATITPGAGFEWVTRPKPYLEGEPHATTHHR